MVLHRSLVHPQRRPMNQLPHRTDWAPETGQEPGDGPFTDLAARLISLAGE